MNYSDKLALIREYKRQGGNGSYLSVLNSYAEGGVIEDPPNKNGLRESPQDSTYKANIFQQYPKLSIVYGNKGENLVIKADTNFKPSEIGYGNIEFFDKEQDSVRYGKGYNYANPNPKGYGILYNPKANIDQQDIFLDLLHGMKADSTFNSERDKFKEQTLKARGDDANYFYNRDREEGFAVDGYDYWINNYTDGLLRSEMYEGDSGDYLIEREHNSPEMKKQAAFIKKYLKTPEKKTKK